MADQAISGRAAATEPPAKDRLIWADAARGLSILLVVYYHSFLIAWTNGLIDYETFFFWNESFRLVRMPLFFFISGFFAARALQRPWPAFLDRTLLNLVWVFLVWNIINVVSRYILSGYSEIDYSGWDVLLSVVYPFDHMWFIWALAIYFLLMRLLRPVPIAIVLVLAAALAVDIDSESVPWGSTARYFVFFVLGIALADRLPELVRSVSAWAALPAVVLFAASATLYVLVPELRLDLVAFTLAMLGIAAAVCLLHWTEHRASSRLLSWFGRRSVPIYVAHMLTAGAAYKLLVGLGVTEPAVVIPLAVIAGVTLPLLAYALALSLGFAWLFRRPAWLALPDPAGRLARRLSFPGAAPAEQARRGGHRV